MEVEGRVPEWCMTWYNHIPLNSGSKIGIPVCSMEKQIANTSECFFDLSHPFALDSDCIPNWACRVKGNAIQKPPLPLKQGLKGSHPGCQQMGLITELETFRETGATIELQALKGRYFPTSAQNNISHSQEWPLSLCNNDMYQSAQTPVYMLH